MWQDIIVYALVAVAAALVAWKFYVKFTGKSSCCGGGGGCSGSCQSRGGGGVALGPMPGSGCGCSR